MPKDKKDVEAKKITELKKLLQKYPSKSDMSSLQLAKRTGLSDKTVQRYRNLQKKDGTFHDYSIDKKKVNKMKKKLMDKVKKDFTITDSNIDDALSKMKKYYKGTKFPINESLITKYRIKAEELVELSSKMKNPATLAFSIYHLKILQSELKKKLDVKLNSFKP